VVVKGWALLANKIAAIETVGGREKAIPNGLVGLYWRATIQSIWGIRMLVCGNGGLHETITVIVVNNWTRAVDGKLLKVG
jgi:hypothetical protein